MKTTLDRRDFIKHGAVVAASLAGVGSLGNVSAIEPIARNGEPKFKFSLAAYSYRSLLSGDSPKLSMADFVDDCAKMGLEGTELTSYYFPADATPEYLRSLKKHCFQLGLDVSGTAVGNDFGHADEAKRKEQIEHVKKWVELLNWT